jgi:tetratricopeptide (TPR) repeat protein
VSRPCYPRTRSCYVSYPRCYSNSLYYAWPSFGYWGGYTTYEPTVIVRETVPYYVEVPVSTESVVTGDYPATVIREAPVVEATPDSEATPPANAAILDEANRLFADGRYSEAREQYLRIVLADGNDGVAKLAYGLSSLALGEFQTAAAAVRGALAATPDLVGNPIDIRGFYREPETFERHVDSVRVHLIRTEADGLTDDAREAGLLLAFLFFASAQAELAETTLAELAGRNPGDSLIHSLLEAARNVLQTRTPAPAAPEPEVP